MKVRMGKNKIVGARKSESIECECHVTCHSRQAIGTLRWSYNVRPSHQCKTKHRDEGNGGDALITCPLLSLRRRNKSSHVVPITMKEKGTGHRKGQLRHGHGTHTSRTKHKSEGGRTNYS